MPSAEVNYLSMQILVFTKNGCLTPTIPQRDGLEIKHVHFESTLLDDLLLIAKYRIINFPMSLIVDGRGNVLLRVKGAIPGRYFDSLTEE